MKKVLSAFFALAVCLSLSAQGGKVFDNLTMKSKILEMERNYAIYLPEDYDTSERSYPVLYLLHGMGDDHTGWIQFGEVKHIADKAIAEGCATPMIIVMPDANTKYVGYFNHPNGEYNYENYFFDELIPHIEKNYRCRTDKRYRAIAGLSMGGGGTLAFALHRPDLFAAACPLSAAVPQPDIDVIKTHYLKQVADSPTIDFEAWYKQYDIFKLIQEWPDENLAAVRWYIDCGDDDFLSDGNALLQVELLKKKIPHQFRVRDGEHNWGYWRESLPEVLKFITVSFHQK